MKRYLIILLACVIMPLVASAADMQKKWGKFVGKYDVA